MRQPYYRMVYYLRAILVELNKYSSCIWALSVLTSSQTHWNVRSVRIVLKTKIYKQWHKHDSYFSQVKNNHSLK